MDNRKEATKERNQVGKLIQYERKRAGLSLDELCRGLCTHTFLMRVEKGERACEKILADALLQRVGVSADKFVYMINPEEQDWLILREKLIAAVDRGNEEEAFPLMESYRKMTEKKSKLHVQRLLLFQVVLGWKNGRDTVKMLQSLQDAWEITMSGIPMEELEDQRLTLTEFVLAMMYARILEERGNFAKAEAGYEKLLCHLEDYTDEEDSVKLYPQIAFQLAGLYLKKGRKDDAVLLAEKSVALLKVRGRLFYLRQFLEIISTYGALTEDEKAEMQEICASLKWLYATYRVPEEVWVWNVSFGMGAVELCGNLIRSRREALGMTQEKLAEGICDPVSVSRIERNEVAPKRQIFKLLMERVGMTGGSFETVAQVEKPELLDLAVEISIQLSHSRGKEAEMLIEKLAGKMDYTDKFSRQFLLHTKALALFNQKKISAQEHAEMQKEALYLTMPQLPLERLEKWCFSNREISIINTLSYSYDRMGQRDEIINLLQIVQKQLENKPFSLEHYVAGYELTMRNLGNVLGNAGRYEEAIEAAEKGIRQGLESGRGAILSLSLYDCGWDMEQLWQSGRYTKEESLHYVKACYALELLFCRPEDSDFTRRHIKQYYGE